MSGLGFTRLSVRRRLALGYLGGYKSKLMLCVGQEVVAE